MAEVIYVVSLVHRSLDPETPPREKPVVSFRHKSDATEFAGKIGGSVTRLLHVETVADFGKGE